MHVFWVMGEAETQLWRFFVKRRPPEDGGMFANDGRQFMRMERFLLLFPEKEGIVVHLVSC